MDRVTTVVLMRTKTKPSDEEMYVSVNEHMISLPLPNID